MRRILAALLLCLPLVAQAATPTVASESTSATTANSTSQIITLPASIAAGDLVVCSISVDSDPTTSWPSPWLKLGTDVNNSSHSLSSGYLIASGGETSVTVTTGASEQSSHHCWRITGHDAAQAPEITTTASASSTTTDPPSIDPTGGAKDFLFIALASVDINPTLLTCTVFPSTYTNTGQEDGNGGTGAALLCWARLGTTGATTENPGAFTYSGTEQAASATIAVHPSEEVACEDVPAITSVGGDNSITATETNIAIVLTGGCDDGSVEIRQNGNEVVQSEDSYTATAIQFDATSLGMGVANGLLYDTGAGDTQACVINANGEDCVDIALTAPSGTEFVELGTPVALTFDAYGNESRLHGGTPTTDPTAASQCARRNLSGLSALTINSDASIEATGTGTFDWDCTDNSGSGGSELYVGSYGSHPNCVAGSTVVCSVAVQGTPPLFGPTPIGDHVLAVSLAMTSYDVDDYFVAGEGAASARALRQLGATTDTTADLSGAHTDVSEILVTNAVAHSSLVKGAWMRIGAAGAPVRIKYVDPVNNLIGLNALRSGSNADAIITYANGAGSVSAVTVNSGTGVVSGTPDTDATTSLLTYRWTDDAGLIAESGPVFEMDVVTITDQVGETLSTGITALEALGIDVNTAAFCASGTLNEIAVQTPSSVLWGTEVLLQYFAECGVTARVIFELTDVTGLTQWVDYIPVSVVPGCVAGRYDEDGCWNVDPLASTTGLTAWVDYTPVFEVSQSANKWRYENDGWIPVNTLTP